VTLLGPGKREVADFLEAEVILGGPDRGDFIATR